jgi:hypothetical protein
MPSFENPRAQRMGRGNGCKGAMRSSDVTTNVRDDSATPLGSLACEIHGSQRSTPQTFTTKAEAGRWLSRTQSEMELGQFVDPKVGKEVLSDYAALWLSTRLVRGRPLSPRTLELYRWQLRKHILPT